jgi:phenylalanyl-tRNA synthetase beta chain
MPTVALERDKLFANLGVLGAYDDDAFEHLCFEFGIELDEITSLAEIRKKDRGNKGEEEEEEEEGKARADQKNDDQKNDEAGEDAVVYKIDIPANRYDLLCMEGLVRALLVFQGKLSAPVHALAPAGARETMVVKPACAQIRPFVVCAVMRDITFTADSYASFLDLQDKLHHNICRRRTLVSVGTHDLDTITGPFVFDARAPSDIHFQPLFEDREFEAKEYLDMLRVHPDKKGNLGKYTDIIYDSPVYPIVLDANGVVMSMPPIINGEHSKMSAATTNVLVEVTATDKTKAMVVLNTMLAMFGEYLKIPFTYEPVNVVYEGGNNAGTVTTPDLSEPEFRANMSEVRNLLGLDEGGITPERACELAGKMMLRNPRYDAATKEIVIEAPCTRTDILHECDVVEDIAVAYGFNNIVERIPPTLHLGKEQPVMKLTELLRYEMCGAGYIEALTFGLCAEREAFGYLNKKNDGNTAVVMSNPMDENNEIVRPMLLPGILKTVASNQEVKVSRGLKLFEVSDVCLLDDTTDTGAKNERHLCAVYTGPTAGLEMIHGVVDRVFELLTVKPAASVEAVSKRRSERAGGEAEDSKDDGELVRRYIIKECDCDTYFPQRSAEILLDAGDGSALKKIGEMGIIHPNVLQNFGLTYPASAMEINLEDFVSLM